MAEGRKIYSSATCGEGISEPELYCKLVGANTDRLDNPNINLIQGQVCDFCDINDPKISHPPEYAIDGTERWWQSPPLSRGNKYNEVNLTIDLGQEFHVAYVFIKMGNSPRPGVWVLERSIDNGESYRPWQYFADTPGDCIRYFGEDSYKPIVKDDSVICETKFSKVVPLEGGEIVVSLLNDRPNADNFSYSPILQEWTKATNVRLRLLRTKTLLGHLMSVARQDPTVTRRYFYSIKDINIGGRCVCNGHADSCDITDPNDPYKLLCRCQHHTCGAQCDQCCPGYVQKKWRRAIAEKPFVCEPCNCFGHSNECVYDEDIDNNRLSLDIHGNYEGGGKCLRCHHHTTGINCNECEDKYYRPYGKQLNDTDVCQECICDLSFSTGNCADGSGLCECRPEFQSPYCDQCSPGYYDYPTCRPCDCDINGTLGAICQVGGGQCPCKPNYSGQSCNKCAEGFYGFPECLSCECSQIGSISPVCNLDNGQCSCSNNFGGRECNQCDLGYYNYPDCKFCLCDPDGSTDEICDNVTGNCLCRPGYGGSRCDQCIAGYFGYPKCEECGCDVQGSSSSVCDRSGRCPCSPNFSGPKCDKCSPGYYNYPECLPCDCETTGSLGISCNTEGHCVCKPNFAGEKCNYCREGFYNYPLCEECNCNPAGIVPTFGGCGSLTSGELCECKRHVTGRICHQCQILYWNLKANNPDGCEDCNCYGPGTLGGLGICDGITGQCMCKPNVASRQCSECKDGTYQLEENNLFGCHDCGCNIGGSVNNNCDKDSGQCACRPRINGRQCDKALQTHYFPTLYQHQFEIEDGRTPANTQVRFGFDENIFPGYSWRGYAIFSDIQKEVLMDIYVEKPSLYQIIFHYLNFGGENVIGTITFTPEGFSDIQQSSDMIFETTNKPKLMRVAGKQGLTAAPFVLNPGRWTVSIRVEKPLFLDYMVLLPQAYYEATLLQEDINIPCKIGQENEPCRHFRYPSISIESSVVRGEAGYVAIDDQRIRTQLYPSEYIGEEFERNSMAWLNSDQTSLHMDMRVSKPGEYVFVIMYHTPEDSETTNVMVELSTTSIMDKGIAVLYECNYSFLCREVVMQADGQIAVFDIDSNSVNLKLTIGNNSNIIIDSIAAIPYYKWHSDFIIPQPQCIKKDGKCLEIMFPPVPEATKVEFESGINADRIATDLPATIFDKEAKLIYLNYSDAMVDIQGSVLDTGKYTLVVHYYQPDHPGFEMDVIIQNGQFYEAILPIQHCPDSAGCRAVIKEKITNNISFLILKNFVLTLKEPNHKSVWVDYVLTIPSSQYDESLLHPLPQDKAGKFITQCGQNNFYITSDADEYCKESAFSLTSEYNNGALPCKCDTDGSLSYECDEFGGQCHCRTNVIGRTCSRCQTGYFGFPNCKPCNCPSTAVCHPTTGQCICPPRVTGEKCDTCIPDTYGFDAIIGCEECNCNPLGVYNLQCDRDSGQCECKPNIVGRICDRCKSGYWSFPLCHLCSCDLRGTTEDICDQDNAKCHCKENVFGDFCDQCKPGTFYLEESNPAGCSKCFCFGTTDRCYSSYLFFIQISHIQEWKGFTVTIDNHLNVENMDIEIEEEITSIKAIVPELPIGTLFYFSAPAPYLGNKIKSYGGNLYYTLSTIDDHESPIGSIIGPDVVLIGNNITIIHNHVEQPSGNTFEFTVNIVEREFQHLTGGEVSREQIMMVLVNLESLLIRGTHFQPPVNIRLSNVLMDITSDHYVADGIQALRVEQCQCPPNYQGTSCEDCAPGYYRSKAGPYLGFCVPCQCNGHSDTCDVNSGKCFNCKHNTMGDHCELCAPGYHGDPTQKTPYDCLICACPLPLESNNFAESCEVSPSGLEISCNCKPGYYGPRCEVCAAGYYGRPDVRGSKCLPCECSGNIDTNNPGSCDSITGDCVLCLNNTFGAACEICAPGYYGDAINQKNCKSCNCDICGTHQCNHNSGDCICQPNVIGYECDHCAPNHWGFGRCQGCFPCNCGIASISEQCNDETGQCDCKSGATGLTCDICEPGYWLYSKDGCTSCNCDEKYSAGAVCNSETGQCQCLPGVIGDKCDSCPYRWTFVDKIGCHECDPCVHALLDDTDYLKSLIDPIWEEMTDISTSYFAYQRLNNVNKTVDELWPKVDSLIIDPSEVNLVPFQDDIDDLEALVKSLDLRTKQDIDESNKIAMEADNKRKMALEMEKLIHEATQKANEIVKELKELAEGLIGYISPSTDLLIAEAARILDELENRNFSNQRKNAFDERELAEELLEEVKNFQMPTLLNKEILNELKEQLKNLENFLSNYIDNANIANKHTDEYWKNTEDAKNIPTLEFIEKIGDIKELVEKLLEKASDFLESAKEKLKDADTALKMLLINFENLHITSKDLVNKLEELQNELEELTPLVEEAKLHADELAKQASILDSLLADTRNSSEGALKAATVYKDIILAIDNASEAAKEALNAADEAGIKSEGVAERAENSKNVSEDLLNTAKMLQQQVTEELKPKLDLAKKGVSQIGQQNEKNTRELDIIDKELEKLPFQILQEAAYHATNKSLDAENRANHVQDRIEDILLKISEEKDVADQIPINLDGVKDAVKKAETYLDLVKTINPEIDELIGRVGKTGKSVTNIGKDLSGKIRELQQKVALAQNQANRIKLGVQFFGNSTLQLRNPEGLDKAATYTHMSLYFNTFYSEGLLVYIGNEKGTHTLLKRALTDDFMSLEIQAGRLVLTVDLGFGVDKIVNDYYVSDGIWHQAIVERTGKTFTLIVRTEDKEDSVKQAVLPGTYSVFNLDQKVSKFYIGGIPDKAQIQPEVLSRHFIGCIEELEFGKTPVGLWNFVEAENNFEGCVERDQLVILQQSNGLRFDGNGYATLPIEYHDFTKETVISMQFKTYASEGLLFLIGKNRDFFSLELKQGRVLLKYELGSGVTTLKSNKTLNDGNWHLLEATRIEKEAILKVDGIEEDNAISQGWNVDLSTTNDIFVGGYPRNHDYLDVTNIDFEGCIKDLQIGTQLKDLNNNKEALGVVSGCPATIAQTVSFSNTTAGYVAMPNINLKRKAELTFKFKTEDDGILFYADNEDHSNYLSITLLDGRLVMRSNPGGEIISKSEVKYNDKQWHYVTATKTNKMLRLDIDDIDFNEEPVERSSNLIITSPLYFGGIPDGYNINMDAVPIKKNFVGCLGDTTVIGVFQNFADSQDRPGASLASCPLAEPSSSTAVTFFNDTLVPTITYSTEPPFSQCYLPLQPQSDNDIKIEDGSRFGNTPWSRQEFSIRGSSILDESQFSLEFKTRLSDGVLLYVAGKGHIDFEALFMQDGKINYAYNCGSGGTLISTAKSYNNDMWHKAVFSRIGKDGILIVDEEEVTGESQGQTSSMNVKSPLYVGGLSEATARIAKNNLKGITVPFPGCIRNVKLHNEKLSKRIASVNVTGCSKKVEEGTFISAEGGYIILYDKFSVGKEITVSMKIKPRKTSGVLMAVHGSKDYLVLQMVEGTVKFTVDNGRGPFTAVYNPPTENYLCNGNWHTINVVKTANVAILTVDGVNSEPQFGPGGVTATDTNDPLYLGGVPDPLFLKGVEVNEHYVGCIHSVGLNEQTISLTQGRIFGQVTLNSCPTI